MRHILVEQSSGNSVVIQSLFVNFLQLYSRSLICAVEIYTLVGLKQLTLTSFGNTNKLSNQEIFMLFNMQK